MSAEVPTTIEELAAENLRLRERLDAATVALVAATAAPPKQPSLIKRIARGVWAAFASTEAVKREKSLAALIATRILINLGASAATVDLVRIGLKALGVSLP